MKNTSRWIGSRRRRPWLLALAVLLVSTLLVSPGAAAVEEEGEDGQEGTIDTSGTLDSGFRFDGDVLVGYRLVNQGGFTPKFREDVDLEEGGRLLHGVLTLLPAGDEPASWFDRIEFRGAGLGGDPYSTWAMEVRKAGTYRLDVRSRQADYFNALSGEIHSWDTTRRNTDVDLSINPLENLEIWGKVRQFNQIGSRVTSRDISRNEFLFDEPLDQEANTWGVGARGKVGTTTVWLEHSKRQFTDNGGFGSRGLNTGLNADEAFLTFLEQREVRSSDAPITRGGVATRFADGRVRITGDFLYSDQSLGFSFARFWEGETFQGRPVEADQSATGVVTREIRHGTLEALWSASDQVTLSVQYRRRGWDQNGENFVRAVEAYTEEGGFDTSSREGVSSYDVTLDQVTVGGEFAPSSSLALFAEVGVTRRDQQFVNEAHESDTQTDTTAYKLGARIRPSRTFDLTASYERGDVDDPFARVAPTETNALKLKARVRPDDRWQLSGNLTVRDRSNDISMVELKTVNFGGMVTYRAGGERWLMVGYSRLDYDGSVPIVYRPFFAGSTTAIADSQVTDNVITLAGEYRAGSSPFTLFGRASYVTSSGELPTTGFTPGLRSSSVREIDFGDWTVGLRYLFSQGLYAQLAGRFVDYEETTELATDLDDYDASIFTFGVGLRF